MSKNILITGSTDGIGKLAAINLLKEGHQVYLHGRNPEKMDKVITEIKKLTGKNNVHGFIADLSYINTIRAFANEVNSTLFKLDVLINNAGVFKSRLAKNNNGLDLRFVVNYLAPVVLTQVLLPLLKESDDGRIINLSSAAQAPVSLAALAGKQDISDQASYAQSKLALTMWSAALAEQHKDLTITALNPGSLLDTNMVKEAYGTSWSSAAKGANIICDLAASDEYKGVTGKYFDNDKGEVKGKFGNAHADAYNAEKIASLLEATESLLPS